MSTKFNCDTADLPVVEWEEYLGQHVGLGMFLVAYHFEPKEPDIHYEVGFSEPDGSFTNAAGIYLPNVWAYARLDTHLEQPAKSVQ